MAWRVGLAICSRAMGLMRALGRAGTFALAGAAAGYYLHRKGLLGGGPATLGPPAEPPFAPQPQPQPEPEPQPETVDGVVEEAELPADEPEPVPEDAELVAVEEALEPEPEDVTEPPPAEEERPDVTAVVDDLLAWGRPQEGAMADADVVDESEDARLAEAVRIALAEEPGLLSAPVDIEVQGGRVTLRGELERPEGIAAVERKVEAVEGVSELQSLLHLTGTPPPERR
jgi:BON domain